jgi:hypothetical protein
LSTIRVSIAALLRVRADNQAHLVLVDTGGPVIGPLGGALAYYPAAGPLLADLDWRPEREPDDAGLVDLRGRLPVRSFPAFVAWLNSERDRESAEAGLRREITEELHETGHGALAEHVATARLAHLRTVTEEPEPVAAGFLQTRRFEIYDLLAGGREPALLRDQLVALTADPAVPTVLAVSEADIAAGRVGSARIGTQAAYLTDTITGRTGITVAADDQLIGGA